jgi:hypothetical protein
MEKIDGRPNHANEEKNLYMDKKMPSYLLKGT